MARFVHHAELPARRMLLFWVEHFKKATGTMIMALNLPESFPTSGLDAKTIFHLQRLVLLNHESRDAYQMAANLATNPQLLELAEQAVQERQAQAATLQNILWCNGTSSRVQNRGEAEIDRRVCQVLNESPDELSGTLVAELLKIEEANCACYENVRNLIQGRGIRQLLTEQALRIQHSQHNLLDLQQEIHQKNAGETRESNSH